MSLTNRLTDHLFLVQTTHSNSYLWLTDDGVTLVDTGNLGDLGDETTILAANSSWA